MLVALANLDPWIRAHPWALVLLWLLFGAAAIRDACRR